MFETLCMKPPMTTAPDKCMLSLWAASQNTIVAEIITELIRLEPEVCICNGK